MPNVYILLGIQGSGKSTWAQASAAKLKAEVLASDAIRNELESQGRHADAANGDAVFAIFNARLARMLLEGKNVIGDATHARRVWRQPALRTARRLGAKIIGVWLDVPLAVCLQRNAASPGGGWGDRVVPEEFLIEVAKGFEKPEEGEFDEVRKVATDGTDETDFLIN